MMDEGPEPREYKELLPKACVNELLKLSDDLYESSMVERPDGTRERDERRTSTSLSLSKLKSKVFYQKLIRILKKKLNIGLDPEVIIDMEILRYTSDQAFKLHHDAGVLSGNEEEGFAVEADVHRVATAIVCLTNGSGGGTYFPCLDKNYQGDSGDGIVFCNFHRSERDLAVEADPRMRHEGRPDTGTVRKVLGVAIITKPA
jgi:hypothetical protein